MKRNSGNWVMYLLVVAGAALMLLLNSSACISTASLPIPEAAFGVHTDTVVVAAAAITTRKLQEDSKSEQHSAEEAAAGDVVGLEDYRPIDPVPSSKASVKPGPIEHGTPLNPFIPRSPPPTPPPSSY